MDPVTLGAAVEQAFEVTSRGLRQWVDPHPPPDRLVADEEYSRVTDPGKWRIVGARVDAWIDVLTAEGLASLERDTRVEWDERPGPAVTRTDLLSPRVQGALALVVGRTRIESVDGAGLVLGVGLPAACLVRIPDCGCDACDSGSADVIDQVDTWIGGIVRGELRHLVRPRRTITVIGHEVRQSSFSPELPTAQEGWRWGRAPDGVDDDVIDDVVVATLDAELGLPPTARIDIDAVLADPTGWREWSGPSWLR